MPTPMRALYISFVLTAAASLHAEEILKDPDFSCQNMRALFPVPGAGPAVTARVYNIQPTRAWVTFQFDQAPESQAYPAKHTKEPMNPGGGVPPVQGSNAETFTFDHPKELFAFRLAILALNGSTSNIGGSLHLESGRVAELNGEHRLLCRRGNVAPTN